MRKFQKGDCVWLGRDLHKIEAVMPNGKYQLDGVFTYVPEDWLTAFVKPEPSESDLRISLAHLRDILTKLVSDGVIEPITMSVDQIIHRIKSQL